MRRSIATISLSGTIEEKLQSAAAADFDAVHISDSDILYYGESPTIIRGIAEDLGLSIDAYEPLRDLEGLEGTAFKKCLDRARKKLDLVAELGAPLVLIPATTLTSTTGEPEKIASNLFALAELASQRGLRLAYGAHAGAAHIRSVADAWSLVKRVGHPHLDLFISSFQMLAAGDPQTIGWVPGNRIAALMLADAPGVTIDPISKNRFYSCFPGEGDLPLSEFVLSILRTGYTGALTLEVLNESFRGAYSRVIAQDGMRSLLLLEENVRKEAARTTDLVVDRVALFDPPAPAKISNLEFLEFAAMGKEAQLLGEWLNSFGFRNLGKHRSKRVTLYRNGSVNIALNSEQNSFAHSHYLLHGPSVCAFGLRADDDQRALARALAFEATQFEGKVGPNELTIPAIRALDGGLIYFVGEDDAKNLYEIEFSLNGSMDESNAPLETVDHLALSLPAGEMDSRVLFYRAVLGFEADSTWMLTDPNGVVKSRAMASVGHAVRIPLNMSQSHRTATARQVDTQAGAGVHHIAFSCADIFATAESLRRSGAKFIEIPSSYYEDLEYRFDLEKQFVSRLKEASILYDRIGEGEFFHIYSEPFQDRFFFEFLQRKGGYDQYGAVNAPFRMAAVAKLQRARVRREIM